MAGGGVEVFVVVGLGGGVRGYRGERVGVVFQPLENGASVGGGLWTATDLRTVEWTDCGFAEPFACVGA